MTMNNLESTQFYHGPINQVGSVQHCIRYSGCTLSLLKNYKKCHERFNSEH